MSLRGNCIICTDYFDGENDISVTQCGHLFHNTCLSQWIKTSGAQKSCPQCRTRITKKQVIEKIFVNLPEENEAQLDPYSLKNKLDDAESNFKKCKLEKNEIQSTLQAMEASKDALLVKINQLKVDVKSERNAMSLLKTDMEIMKSEVEDARKAKEETKQLKLKLKMLEKVEIVLNSQKYEVDDMLNQYTNGSNSHETKQLATFCVAMKQEYETIKESRTKLSNEVMRLKRDIHKKEEMLLSKASIIEELELSNLNLRKSEEALNEENSSLRRKLGALKQAISSPSDTRSSAINRLIVESPAPEFLTPGNDLTRKRTKIRSIAADTIQIKRTKRSASFEDISDMDDSTDMIEKTMHVQRKIENSLPISESPTTSKIRKHCKEMGINFVQTVAHAKSGQNKSNSLIASTIRSKILSNKNSTKIPIGYDGFGGHKKLLPSRPTYTTTTRLLDFSSSNTANFKTTNTNVRTSQSRLQRLKRIAPR